MTSPGKSTKSGSGGEDCFRGCFPQVPQLHSHPLQTLLVNSSSIESPVERQSLDVSACYAPLSDVLCPQKNLEVASIPAIDLILGEPVSHGKIYPLSLPSRRPWRSTFKEALEQRYMHPPTSPAASRFFFMAKKDRGLLPCIDYRALNKITVKPLNISAEPPCLANWTSAVPTTSSLYIREQSGRWHL